MENAHCRMGRIAAAALFRSFHDTYFIDARMR